MRAALVVLAALTLSGVEGGASEGVPEVGPAGPVTADQLMRLDHAQLDELMAKAEPGPLPDGVAVGVANRDPGSSFGGFTRGFFKGLWEGKTDLSAGIPVLHLKKICLRRSARNAVSAVKSHLSPPAANRYFAAIASGKMMIMDQSVPPLPEASWARSTGNWIRS